MKLNRLLLETWRNVGFHAFPVAPSSCAVRERGGDLRFDDRALRRLLDEGRCPVVFGDVVMDETQGFSIAGTEDVFLALAASLSPRRIILASDVDGVYAADPRQVPAAERLAVVSAENEARVTCAAAACDAPDVTGRMAGKVARLRRIAAALPDAEIRIVTGLKPGVVAAALRGAYDGGTLIR